MESKMAVLKDAVYKKKPGGGREKTRMREMSGHLTTSFQGRT